MLIFSGCLSVCLSARSEIVLEKFFRGVQPRSVLDGFFEAQLKASSPAGVPPCLTSGKNYVLSIVRHNLHFVALLQQDGISFIFPHLFSSLLLRLARKHAYLCRRLTLSSTSMQRRRCL